MENKFSIFLFGVIILVIGIGIGFGIDKKINFTHSNVAKSIGYELHEGGGRFTNPLLECTGSDNSFGQINVSKSGLENLVNSITDSGKVKLMSVYFRDLNNGPWIGVNEHERFVGGSLLKVPILISYLKLSETDPTILNKTIDYKKQLTTNLQYFSSSRQLEVGKSYTIEELLENMIYYSDNNAALLLSNNLGTRNFDDIFTALGMGTPDPNSPYPVDAQTYAAFFRILFNASYLSRSTSEKALDMLSHVEFNRGIQGQLPNNIVVSHKFGERSDGDINQLHDCGIVYYPNNPYLLCIMSQGGTFPDMADAIAKVSKFVYDQVKAAQ